MKLVYDKGIDIGSSGESIYLSDTRISPGDIVRCTLFVHLKILVSIDAA